MNEKKGIIPPTNFTFTFPKGKEGIAAYMNGSGIYRKFKLSAEDVLKSPNKTFSDSVTEFIELDNVEVEATGYVYECLLDNDKKWCSPDLNVTFIPKQFKVYYGNIYNPAGSILYFDENNDSKAVTKFGKVEIIIVTKFLQITNCKLIEL